MKLNRKWKIFLIHHSHTDIGYTERQEKIAAYHVEFIRQAIAILESSRDSGFVWQCENYWQVENFYKHASTEETEVFEEYVKAGKIGISLNYLNMTELITDKVLHKKIKKAKDYCNAIGANVTSAMTADINGYAWGYADALKQNGVDNLYCCLHTHHGMFPLLKKQIPFYWEAPSGEKLLVWNGEHYHVGNELLFAPLAGTSYTIFDDDSRLMKNDLVFNKNHEDTIASEKIIFEKRISAYLSNLEQEGYPYDFIPMMVSGTVTDNSAPSAEIAQRVSWINEMYGDRLQVEMSTLDSFFVHLRANGGDIPVYSGDWADWWADGVGSTPQALKLFKDAQRKYNLIGKLDDKRIYENSDLLIAAEDNLMLYAEHTWGYSSSIAEPWETLVSELELKKSHYAVEAHNCTSRVLDSLLTNKGSLSIGYDIPQYYKIINPHSVKLKSSAFVYLGMWEYINGVRLTDNISLKVVDRTTRKQVPFVLKNIVRAYELEVFVELGASSEMEIEILLNVEENNSTIKNHAYIGADQVEDLLFEEGYQVNTSRVETDHFVINFQEQTGISSIIDKSDNLDLIRQDNQPALFSGIYEVTETEEKNQREVRRLMGRNRKSKATKRFYSVLTNTTVTDNNDVFVGIELEYALEGTKIYRVRLKVYKGTPQIKAKIILHKTSAWSPENLYVSLPVTVGVGEEKYIDKTGCFFRPGIDQLPGSNQDFYLTQNAVCLVSPSKTIVVNLKDTPLITLGSLKAKPIELCSEKSTRNGEAIHVWAMNNFWETNFKADLAGFYEFEYIINLLKGKDKKYIQNVCESLDQGFVAFRTR